MKSVFIFGHGSAAYRPGMWAKFFLDRPKEYSLILLTGANFSSFCRPLRVVFRCILIVHSVIGSELVIMQPMSHDGAYGRLVIRL